jgi:hypothetical protein
MSASLRGLRAVASSGYDQIGEQPERQSLSSAAHPSDRSVFSSQESEQCVSGAPKQTQICPIRDRMFVVSGHEYREVGCLKIMRSGPRVAVDVCGSTDSGLAQLLASRQAVTALG